MTDCYLCGNAVDFSSELETFDWVVNAETGDVEYECENCMKTEAWRYKK